MLHTLRKLKGSMLVTSDEQNIGEVKDFYFDDEQWAVRYLVVNTGSWFSEDLILISPYMIKEIEWGGFNLKTNLTREQIKGCPSPDDKMPVSRLYEEKYARYYQLPYYWTTSGDLWPNNIYPTIYANMMYASHDMTEQRKLEKEITEKIETTHLRSYHEVMGYKIHAQDEVFGHAEDMVMDEENFKLRFLVIDTINFLPSKSVLVSTEEISSIDWERKELRTDLRKEEIKNATAYDPLHPINMNPEL